MIHKYIQQYKEIYSGELVSFFPLFRPILPVFEFFAEKLSPNALNFKLNNPREFLFGNSNSILVFQLPLFFLNCGPKH